jgi:hypothetical protein
VLSFVVDCHIAFAALYCVLDRVAQCIVGAWCRGGIAFVSLVCLVFFSTPCIGVRLSFLDRLFEYAESSYVPSIEDILRSRVRTVSVSETRFDMEGTAFR